MATEVFLAPMSGVTDAPFRASVREFGVGTLVSEMVASGAMVQTMRDSRKLREVFDPEQPTVLQLAGTDPDLLATATQIAQDRGAGAIDLNFGCPARKVTGKSAGSALMREPDLCLRIFAAVGQVARVPWSVKMRLGWDEMTQNAPDLAQGAAAAGASRISVHGRTRCQFYKGVADWAAVRPVVQSVQNVQNVQSVQNAQGVQSVQNAQGVPIPVIVNGDIGDARSAQQALHASHAEGYMVGRATTGLPWRLREIEMARLGTPWRISLADQARAHAHLLDRMLVFYGADLGLKTYRKHLSAWLLTFSVQVPDYRGLLTSTDPKRIFDFLRDGYDIALAA